MDSLLPYIPGKGRRYAGCDLSARCNEAGSLPLRHATAVRTMEPGLLRMGGLPIVEAKP